MGRVRKYLRGIGFRLYLKNFIVKERNFTMKILSEKTNKYYDTVEDCIAAEKEFDDAVKAEEEKRALLATARKDRANEVEQAYQRIQEIKQKATEDLKKARKEYEEKLTAFCKDYG